MPIAQPKPNGMLVIMLDGGSKVIRCFNVLKQMVQPVPVVARSALCPLNALRIPLYPVHSVIVRLVISLMVLVQLVR